MTLRLRQPSKMSRRNTPANIKPLVWKVFSGKATEEEGRLTRQWIMRDPLRSIRRREPKTSS